MILEISLDKMMFYAHHGVLEQERLVGNNFAVDLVLRINAPAVLEEDNLDLTVNYAEVYTLLKREMLTPSALLEHVVGRIARVLFAEFSVVESLSIKLTKLNPPFSADIQGASVRLSMNRQEYYELYEFPY